MKPDRHKQIGDLATGGGIAVSRETWSIEEREEVSDEDFAEGAERCLDRLIDRLERAGVSEKLRAAGLASMAELKLGGFCKEVRNANVWHTSVRIGRLAALGLPLGEDFYQLVEEELPL